MFKNVIFYTFAEMPELTNKAFEEATNAILNPINLDSTRASAYGFTLAPHCETFCFTPQKDNHLLSFKYQEKKIPTAALNEEIDKRAAVIEKKEDRKISRKERQMIKDDVLFQLLPSTPASPKVIPVYITSAYKTPFIAICTSSRTMADYVIHTLVNIGFKGLLRLFSDSPLKVFPRTATDLLSIENVIINKVTTEGLDKSQLTLTDINQDSTQLIAEFEGSQSCKIKKFNLSDGDGTFSFTLNDSFVISQYNVVDIEKAQVDEAETALDRLAGDTILAIDLLARLIEVIDENLENVPAIP